MSKAKKIYTEREMLDAIYGMMNIGEQKIIKEIEQEIDRIKEPLRRKYSKEFIYYVMVDRLKQFLKNHSQGEAVSSETDNSLSHNALSEIGRQRGEESPPSLTNHSPQTKPQQDGLDIYNSFGKDKPVDTQSEQGSKLGRLLARKGKDIGLINSQINRTYKNEDLSLCKSCNSMTHTIKGKCGKCKRPKGCGRKFMWTPFDEGICGQIEDLKHSGSIILCPVCRKEKK